MQKKFVLIFCCTFHEILLLLIVKGGAINFDALHQLLYLYPNSGRPSEGMLTHLPVDKMAAVLADDTLKCIFFNENDRISSQISLKFVLKWPIDNKPALVQVMAWHRTGDKPLPELMLTQFIDAYMSH